MKRLTKRGNVGNKCNYSHISHDCQIDEGIEIQKEVIEELARYKELEEKGLLLSLPCELSTHVYVIPTPENGLKKVTEMILLGYSISKPCNVANLFSTNRADKSIPKMYQPSIEDFGKTWFSTYPEEIDNEGGSSNLLKSAITI